MKLFVDTNVLLDILLKRKPYCSSSKKALLLNNMRDELFFSAKSATDIHYILRKAVGESESRIALGKLFQTVNCVNTEANDILCGLVNDFPDFEDSVAEAIAVRIGANCIITRNKKDFSRSRLPVYTPEEYIKMYDR